MGDVRWIKICTDMAKNKKIKRIRKMPDGDRVVLIWVMLLLQSGDSNRNGGLYLTDTMPFTAEDLAIEFDFDLDLMKMALTILSKFEMISIFDEIIFIKNWNEYQNIQGLDKIKEKNRERVARHRKQKKIENNVTLQNVTCNVTETLPNITGNVSVTVCNAIDKEIDKELDKELELELEVEKNKTPLFSPKYYSENLKELTPWVIDMINSYLDDGFDDMLILEAMKMTKDSGKHFKDPIKYVCGILNNWGEEQIKTIVHLKEKNKKPQKKSKLLELLAMQDKSRKDSE